MPLPPDGREQLHHAAREGKRFRHFWPFLMGDVPLERKIFDHQHLLCLPPLLTLMAASLRTGQNKGSQHRINDWGFATAGSSLVPLARMFKTAAPAQNTIASFSMEVGLDSSIPTYSGGLGVLAGDTLRAAGLPPG